MSIEANMKSREVADAVCELMLSECHSEEGIDSMAYWRRIIKWMRETLADELWPTPEVERDLPMTDAEAARFGNQIMEFSTDHKGKLVKDVPVSFRDWLESQPDFRRQMNRYRRNPRIQREEEAGSDA